MGVSPVHAAHVNGRQPGSSVDQELIYMMTYSPLPRPEDLKPLIRTAIQLVSFAEDVEDEYSSLLFCLATCEQGGGSYLLLGM